MHKLRSSLALVGALRRCTGRPGTTATTAQAISSRVLHEPRRFLSTPSSSGDGRGGDDDAKKRTQQMSEYYSQYLQEYYVPASEADEGEDVSAVKAGEATPSTPLERGESGVFDPDELVSVLREERAENIVCISVPDLAAYADFIVICSCFNFRHIDALSETVQRLYKLKRRADDPPLTLAGGNDKHWRAMDMGNIVLHIMTEHAREKYDLEQLWSVGPEFDQLNEQQQKQQQRSADEYDDWLSALPPPRSAASNLTTTAAAAKKRSDLRRPPVARPL